MIIAAALVAIAAPAQAQVYKCPEGGRVVFSDRPCHADAVPVIPAREDRQAMDDTNDSRRAAANKAGVAAVTSISLSPLAINSSARAAKDAWKVNLHFKDKDDKLVYLSEVDGIRYSATVYEEDQGVRGRTVGFGSGKTVRDFSHHFIVKVSTRQKTMLLTEASITLPDGRRFEAVDVSMFLPGPL